MYYLNQCWQALPSRTEVYDAVSSALSSAVSPIRTATSFTWNNPVTVAKYFGLSSIAVSAGFSSAVYFGIWSFICARVFNEDAFDANLGGPSPFQDSPNTMIITIAALLQFVGSPLAAKFFPEKGHEKAKRTVEKFQRAFGTLGYVFYLRESFNISKDMRWTLALLSLPAFIVLFFSLIGLALTRSNLQSYHDKLTHFFKTKWGQRVAASSEGIAEAVDAGTLWTAGVVGFIEYFVSGRSLESPVNLTNILAVIAFVVGAVFSLAASAYDAWSGKKEDDPSTFKKIIKIFTNTFSLIFAWLEFIGTYMIVSKPKIAIGTPEQSVSAFKYLAQYTDPFAGLMIAFSFLNSMTGVYLPRINRPSPLFQNFCGYIGSILRLNTLSLDLASRQWSELYQWAQTKVSGNHTPGDLNELLLADTDNPVPPTELL
jgi:hypothetical protein